MGRTVVGDENQLEAQVDSIFRKGCSVQVGLLVGNSGSGGSRDLVFALAPTPMKDGEEAALLGSIDAKGAGQGGSRKASKAKLVADSAPMVVGTDWVGEHARQVSRMLLGGMQVMGVYAFCSEGTFKSSLATLWQAVMAVAASASPSLHKGEAFEYLLLHISSSPRRLSCRSCPRDSKFSTSALRPCEWKLGKLLNNLQEFSCSYTVDIRYPVQIDQSDSAINSLREDLSSAIASEAERLQAACPLVDGSLVEPDKLLGSGSTVHTVELLLPFDGGAHLQPPWSGGKTIGKVVFNGEVHARAYAVVREPISRAIADLKGDIVASLRTRLELLVDEAEQAADDADLYHENKDAFQGSRSDVWLMGHLSADVPEQSFIMPRRVLVPWLQGANISDYMLPSESFEDVQERAMDLFGIEEKIDPSVIIEPEVLGIVPTKSVNCDIKEKCTDPNNVEINMVQAKTACSTTSFTLIGAALVLLIALVLSFLKGVHGLSGMM